MMTDANVMLQTWASKKYAVVYLTARAHIFRAESREWLEALTFPTGPMITSNAVLATDPDTEAYKANWLQRMVSDFGWSIVAAYGNEDTDIEAYASVNIPNDHIFIIGPVGGDMGSVAIANDDFTSHVANFVDAQPDAD
jgi:phosphatidate phosphatase PAH1